MYPCFLLGYFLRVYKDKYWKSPVYNGIIFPVAAFIFALCYQFYGTSVYKDAWHFSLVGSCWLWKPYLIKLTLGLSASVCIFSLFRLLEKSETMKLLFNILSSIGTRTLGIYLIQTLVIETILAKLITLPWQYGFYSVIIPLLIATFLLPFLALIVRMIERYKLTAYIMLGKKHT